MRPLRFALDHADFVELPRHPAYRYRYEDGQAVITPLPRYFHCRLDLAGGPADAGQTRPWPGTGAGLIRPVQDADWGDLAALFALAFREVEPFAGLNETGALHAARMALAQTRTGGDGPVIGPACLVAEEAGLVGAALTTLVPPGDPTAESGYAWSEPPPSDAVATRHGRPHLTWIFVRPFATGRGVGAALLAAVRRELRALGFGEVLSTFLDGNTSSMLWHWRMGFALLQHPESFRRTTRLG